MFRNSKSHLRASTLVWLALSALSGCGARSVDAHGGESHFLGACNETCSGGLECIRGACTQTCKSDNECSTLDTSATCVDAASDAAHCDVECETNDACASLGGNFDCLDGVCRIEGTQNQAVAIEDAALATDEQHPDAALATDEQHPDAAPTPDEQHPDAASPPKVKPRSPDGGIDAGGGGSSAGSCRYAHVWYESGDEVPAGMCTTCVCDDGEVVCEPALEQPCPGLPVTECPAEPVPSDNVTVDLSYIEDYTLTLLMSYGGGCQTHDFSVCYEPGFMESYPSQIRLRLTHDAHDDACFAIGSTEQRFDLMGIADMYEDIYDGSILVVTEFGTLATGELTCEDRRTAPRFQLQHIVDQLDLTCQSDDDCEAYPVQTDCFEACDVAVSVLQNQPIGEPDAISSKELLAREIARVNEDVCATYTAECGDPGTGSLCTGPDACFDTCPSGVVPRCIDDKCQMSDE